MIGREMRVAFDHHRRTPTTEALQLVRRRPRLAMPRGPGVPCIVPAEILDAGTLQGFLQARVLALPSGLPAYVNTRCGCLPSCLRKTSIAVALTGTVI